MTLTQKVLAAVFGATLFMAPAVAAAASATIQSLAPSASVIAKTNITFSVLAAGFNGATYRVSDSFSGSTVSNGNINGGGQFSWVPVVSDVGTHNLTITVTDYEGNSASVVQSVTIMPPPSISIQGIAANASVMPGNTLTFSVSQNGFTNPTYTPTDSFGGSTLNGNPNVMTSSGNFSWKPDISQNGEHTITIYATDTAGHSASASIAIKVGSGPTLSMPPNFVSNVTPGQVLSFTMVPTGYSPTAFSIYDAFPNSTLSSNNINATGAFNWSPQASDIGSHTVTISGQVGAYGSLATTTQTINVLGPNGYLPPPPSTAATTTANTGMSALQQQLALLQAQINGATNPAPVVSGGFTFTLALKQGSENDEVLELQKLLQKEGYLKVAPNGYYGPSTVAAVKKFQAAKKLSQLGTVGPGTRTALNAITGGTAVSSTVTASSGNGYVFNHFMGPGDDDVTEVTELQKRLKALGYYTESVTGYYGTATEAAVKKYQAAKGIAPSGYVALITRTALNK